MKKFLRIAEHSIEFLDDRFYPVETENGMIYYPSVTTVLDVYPKGAQFEQWLKDVGNSAGVIATRAAESGSKVHDAIYKLDEGIELEWNDAVYSFEEWQGILRFKDFYDRFKPKDIAHETMIYSHKHKYAGMADKVCEIDGKIWLIDYKFGNAIYQTYWLQIVAYKNAWNEIHPNMKVEEVGILHLKAATRTEGKKGSIQGVGWRLAQPDQTHERLYEIFLKTLDIFYFENPDPRPKNLIYPSKIKL